MNIHHKIYMKLYETSQQTIYRGLTEESMGAAKTAQERNHLVIIYASNKDFLDHEAFLEEIQLSNWVAMYSYPSEIENDWIIERHKKATENSKPFIPVAGIKGSIKYYEK